MFQGRIRGPPFVEEEQRRTIGLDGPDLRLEPSDRDLTGVERRAKVGHLRG